MSTTNLIKTSMPAGPDNVKNIAALEEMLQATIPNDLKQLLILYDRIVFDRKGFKRVVDSSFSQKMTLEEVHGSARMLQAHDFMDSEPEIKDNHLLMIGETLGSPIICIGIGKENYDAIYVFDYNFGLTKVSASFNAFIESLYM